MAQGMYYKVPLGFKFERFKTTKQIINNQVLKFTKTWRNQRIYKSDYGVDWQSFDYTIHKDQESLSDALQQFLIGQYTNRLPQITVLGVQITDRLRSRNNFTFNLVYRYKQLFQETLMISMNLDSEVEVQFGTGSF